ncbi:MAG: SUMF1/EgtB/PvdO family nonheme iron enzyme [Nitrospinaceae bacterium]
MRKIQTLLRSLAALSFHFLLILMAVTPVSSGAEALPAHEIEQRLQSILSASEDGIDLAESALLISRHWDPTIDTVALGKELDRLTASARQKIKENSSPEEIVSALRKTIHEEGEYRYTERVDPQGIPLNPAELFLHGMLASHRGYCMNLSLLYLIIGDRLGLPLFGVPMPNHFFVRYDSGGFRINIEATELGARFPDSFYRKRFGLETDSSRRFFMQNMGKKKTLGAYFSNVGMIFYKNKQPDTAVFYLELSTAINPESVEAQNNLANIYSEQNRREDAIRHYRLALKSDPNNSSTLFNLGLAYQKSGESQKAVDAFLQAVQIDPAFIPGHRVLVKLYLVEKKYTSALLHLKILTRLDPGDYQTQITLGRVYLFLGQNRLALDNFNRVRERFPGNPEVLDALAETYYRLEDWDRAIRLYRYLIENQPDRLKAYIQLGWTHYRKGELKLAAAWTKRGLKKGEAQEGLLTLAHMNLGFFALMDRNYSEARNWYLKAMEDKNSGVVTGMAGDILDAEKRFSNRPDLEFFAGWIYFEGGYREDARLHLKQYLDGNASGEFAQEARDLLQQLASKKTTTPENSFPRFQRAAKTPDIPEDMVLIPAGFFFMGSNKGGEDEAPEHKVYVDAFLIDKYEVTARSFAQFLNTVNNVKGYYLDNKFGMLFYNGRFETRPGLESYPVNNVNWVGAKAFCKWKGKRLPTEAEWEKAARGPNKFRYPWGNERPTPQRARYFQSWTEELGHRVMVPVNALPEGKSPFGLFNMAGNVKEWVDDWYDREYYGEKSHTVNPKGPIGGEFKVLRGGSWRDLGGFIYSSFRNNSYPDSRLDDYGFRCAKSLEASEAPKKLIRWPFSIDDENYQPTYLDANAKLGHDRRY